MSLLSFFGLTLYVGTGLMNLYWFANNIFIPRNNLTCNLAIMVALNDTHQQVYCSYYSINSHWRQNSKETHTDTDTLTHAHTHTHTNANAELVVGFPGDVRMSSCKTEYLSHTSLPPLCHHSYIRTKSLIYSSLLRFRSLRLLPLFVCRPSPRVPRTLAATDTTNLMQVRKLD